MRNPARIHEFCNKLEKAWWKVPDWRFGQLINNVFRDTNNDNFYTEDNEMIQIIEEFINKVTGEDYE